MKGEKPRLGWSKEYLIWLQTWKKPDPLTSYSTWNGLVIACFGRKSNWIAFFLCLDFLLIFNLYRLNVCNSTVTGLLFFNPSRNNKIIWWNKSQIYNDYIPSHLSSIKTSIWCQVSSRLLHLSLCIFFFPKLLLHYLLLSHSPVPLTPLACCKTQLSLIIIIFLKIIHSIQLVWEWTPKQLSLRYKQKMWCVFTSVQPEN